MGSEAKLEKDLRQYAEEKDVVFLKLHGRGWPDRLLLGRNGRLAFIELKASNGRPGPLQERRVKTLAARGFRATFIHNHRDGEAIIDSLL